MGKEHIYNLESIIDRRHPVKEYIESSEEARVWFGRKSIVVVFAKDHFLKKEWSAAVLDTEKVKTTEYDDGSRSQQAIVLKSEKGVAYGTTKRAWRKAEKAYNRMDRELKSK